MEVTVKSKKDIDPKELGKILLEGSGEEFASMFGAFADEFRFGTRGLDKFAKPLGESGALSLMRELLRLAEYYAIKKEKDRPH